MPKTTSHLATLIGSRICHDLISPIGAIHNGLELLELSGQLNNSPEMQLIAESCQNARARVTFFRTAFGMSQGSQIVSAKALMAMIDPLYQGRISVTYSGNDDMERIRAQCILLAILCLDCALPQGGNIEIYGEDARCVLTATSLSLCWDDHLWRRLEPKEDASDIAPSQVQFLMLHALSDGGKRQVFHDDTSITLSF